jgi:hypothetical protein
MLLFALENVVWLLADDEVDIARQHSC